MSGFFGIFNRNGKPVEEKTVNTMLEAMSYWEPDDHGTWIDGSVALGHTMLWNTPESKYEHLPLEKDTFVLTMDARIDNRVELSKDIVLPDRPISEIGDSEFILAAYQKWGEECPKHLLGDFAFVIWDEKKQQIFCARDPFGIKLFHYYLDDSLFVFSSDILGVLSHPRVPKDYDEKTLSIFLRGNGVNTLRDTFFDKIKKLSGGTSLIVSLNEVKESIFWRIENSPPIYYDTYQEYVDALRNLLESAVEARLRTSYPVVSHLSGGIDSSPIAVLAARKLRKKQQSINAYNWINIPRNDEEYELEAYEFSRRIAELEKIDHHEFAIDPEEVVELIDTHDIFTKGTMFYWREYYIQNEAMNVGARTILSGWGGDEFISISGHAYIRQLFRERKFVLAFKALYKEKKYIGYSWYRFMKKFAIMMDIPFLKDYIKWKNKKTLNSYEVNDYFYIKSNFIEVMKKCHFEEFPDTIGIHNRQRILFHYGHLQNRIESWALSAFSKRVEYSYPLLDRRIVEFAFGIPEEIFFPKEWHHRHLIRSAASSLLPSDIAWFPKSNENKVNITYRKHFIATMEKWYQQHKNDNSSIYENQYTDYKKILSTLKTYDFCQTKPYTLHNILVAILVSNMMKK
jgi:asparagine synthase (glutamine-hydrolysing)